MDTKAFCCDSFNTFWTLAKISEQIMKLKFAQFLAQFVLMCFAWQTLLKCVAAILKVIRKLPYNVCND